MRMLKMFAASVAIASSVTQVHAAQFNTIMVSGRPAGDPLGPQLGADIQWLSPDTAVLNAAGQVAFMGRLLSGQGGVTAASDRGIWRWEDGSKTLLVREASPALGFSDGTVTRTLSALETISISDDGTAYFPSRLQGGAITSASDYALIVVDEVGNPFIVAQRGKPASSLSPIPYGTLLSTRRDGPGLTSTGQMLYAANLGPFPGITASNDLTLWFGEPSNPSLLLREGDPLPAYGAGATVAEGGFNVDNAFAAGDQVVYFTPVENGSTSQVLFGGIAGGISEIIKQGDAAPGTNGEFVEVIDAKVSPVGHAVFSGYVLDGDYLAAIYRSLGGAEDLVMLSGTTAPGTSEAFGEPAEFAVSTSGHVGFYASLAAGGTVDSTNDTGVWVYDADQGVNTLAVREGDAVPGLNGAFFGETRQFAMNDNRDVVFYNELRGNVTAAENVGIFHADANGVISTIVQLGDQFDVDPSAAVDLRTIASAKIEGRFNIVDSQVALEYAFNDDGLLLFSLGFTDGTSGLFTAQIGVIPEPTSLLLLVMAGLAGVAGRSRFS